MVRYSPVRRPLERERADHLQPRVLPRRPHGQARLVERRHGLDAAGVRAARLQRRHLLAERVVELLLGHVAHQQHLARRADRGDHVAVGPGRLAGDRRRRAVQFRHTLLPGRRGPA